MRRRRFLQSLLGIAAAVYVPGWKMLKIHGPSLRLDITTVDDKVIDSAAYIDGRRFEVSGVCRRFNIDGMPREGQCFPKQCYITNNSGDCANVQVNITVIEGKTIGVVSSAGE